MTKIPKALFISHGGGPLPLLGDPGHHEMVACLKNIAASFPKPDAIVVVSAHWEEQIPTITAGQSPSLIYDYSGFPEAAYDIQYPCAGNPSLASEVYNLLEIADIKAKLDDSRGFDHGLFVPLKIMYPKASIPCIQLSLVNTLDPSLHLKIGRALQSLNQKNVLLIGSGFSFHNLQAFFTADTPESQELYNSFQEWLTKTCCNSEYSAEERTQRLIGWADAYGARFCHPREEHLLPLHVCYGAAQTHCANNFKLNIMNKKSSMYLW